MEYEIWLQDYPSDLELLLLSEDAIELGTWRVTLDISYKITAYGCEWWITAIDNDDTFSQDFYSRVAFYLDSSDIIDRCYENEED